MAQLPKGNWIGGTIPYFMDTKGGVCTESQIFVNEVAAQSVEIREYTVKTLPSVCKDAPDNGYAFIIMPAGSPVHTAYAQNAPQYEGIFLKPVVGWVSGVLLSELGKHPPKVFNGLTGASSSSDAVVMDVTLPKNQIANLEIVNVFKPGSGETIMFPVSGFSAGECKVNGKAVNFAKYLTSQKIDTRLPLTANYNGSIVNVSVQSVDEAKGTVRFYAPVFRGIEYKIAEPVPDYVKAFESAIRGNGKAPSFACNCILNYLYANLEGKRTGSITGPITFGEVAHQLLNQTLVRLELVQVG